VAGRVCRAHTASSHRAHPSAGPLAQAPRCAPTIKNHLKFLRVFRPLHGYVVTNQLVSEISQQTETNFYYDVSLIEGDLTGSNLINA